MLVCALDGGVVNLVDFEAFRGLALLLKAAMLAMRLNQDLARR